ncbi:MFS transporter [Bacillus salipaludis]|uniref:MFS transporter n=1 Tax=Bacillus salipaludis TaxID=2547811 RepID=A0A4R5VVR6_9BACI|nr:MFS transporter [Bacillus salipaludis]MDQ6597241.1 MFS transporter [Bacillus salipaludis]TDK63314.1 MFS transporter [Bacillus salipaludis]
MFTNNKRWIYVAVPIFFFWFFGQIDKLGISIIQTDPGFLKDLGLTGADHNAKIGFLTFIFTVSYAISNIFWGFVIDKLGARKTAFIGITIWTITMIMGGLADSYGTFMTSRILLGIGEGIMIPVCGKLISNWFNRKEIGRAQASWISGNYLGPAIGALALSAIIASLHWHAAFFFLAFCNLLINIPLFIFLTRETPEQHPGISEKELKMIRENDSAESETIKQGFTQDFRYWVVFVGNLMASFIFYGISIWLPTYLIQAKHFERETMAGITSFAFIFALGFVLISGFLSDKTKRPNLLAVIWFGLCASFLWIAASSNSALLAGVCMALAIGTLGGIFHVTNMLTVKYSTPKTAGRAAGLMGFTNILGGFSSYIMGWMRDLAHGDFLPSIIMLIVVALIGMVVYMLSLRKESIEVAEIKTNQVIL